MPMTAASSSTQYLKKDSINKEFIEEVFANCDTAGTGFISIKKLKIVMRAVGLEPRQEEVNKIAKRMLENETARSVNSEAFTAEELIYVLSDRLKDNDGGTAEIHSTFRLFDTEGKGYVTAKDLQRISNELGENLDEDELKEMISIADTTKKGYVTPKEFKIIMEKISLY